MMNKKTDRDAVEIKGLLKKMLRENKLQPGLDLIQIKNVWKKSMGAGVNTYTKEISFNKGVLSVTLVSSTLREELSYGKEKIVIMLNEQLEKPIIQSIRLK